MGDPSNAGLLQNKTLQNIILCQVMDPYNTTTPGMDIYF